MAQPSAELGGCLSPAAPRLGPLGVQVPLLLLFTKESLSLRERESLVQGRGAGGAGRSPGRGAPAQAALRRAAGLWSWDFPHRCRDVRFPPPSFLLVCSHLAKLYLPVVSCKRVFCGHSCSLNV